MSLPTYCYAAADVLNGWRSKIEADKSGTAVKMPDPDPSAIARGRPPREKGDGVDRGWAMWMHVEIFWGRHFHLHPQRPFLLLGIECEAQSAFEDWYECHPLVRSYPKLPDEGGTRDYSELAWMPVPEAVEAFRRRTGKDLRYNTVLSAVRRGAIEAIRPEGRWHIRVCDLLEWESKR